MDSKLEVLEALDMSTGEYLEFTASLCEELAQYVTDQQWHAAIQRAKQRRADGQ